MEHITPSEFARKRLGLSMWSKFSEIFEAVEAGHRRILVRSANGVGKTTALAALCNWKLSTSKECIVLTTSSSEQQLSYNLWGEIRRQAGKGLLYDAKYITDTCIKLDEKKFMVAVSPAKPESAQGYHAESMFIAVDEATGVRRDILSSLIATATGDDVQIIMIYNPLTTDSYVYEAERSGEWKVITISAFEHPNVVKQNNKIKGAVTLRSTENNLALWSEQTSETDIDAVEFLGKYWRRSQEVSRRILGEWYEESGEGIISRELLNDSLNANAEPGIKTMGIDLAGGGEAETVIARFDGGIQLPLIVMRTSDSREIMEVIRREFHNGFTRIAIDETGTMATMTQMLELRDIKLHSVHFASQPVGVYNTANRKLGNKRIEMFYHLLEELRQGKLRLVEDQKLHQELAAIRLSRNGYRIPYYLEKKEHIIKRIGHSPDRADATALARYANLLEGRRATFIM